MGTGLVQMTAIKCYIQYFGLSHDSQALETDRNLIFSGIFVAAPSQKQFKITSQELSIQYHHTFLQMPK
jgi:hypothetical protein